MAVKLFIGGFPLEMDEMGLAQLVGPHGTIEIMKIVRDKKTRICKGYAFVEMKTMADAEAVMIALDDEPLGDRKLSVKLADVPPAPKARPQAARYPRPSSPSREPEKKKRPRRPTDTRF